MQKCDECDKGSLQEKKIDYLLLGRNLGKFGALVCNKCKETIFLGETFDLIEKKAREMGLLGIAAKTRIGTSGNALDVKFPKPVVEFMHLRKGQEVLIEPVNENTVQIAVVR